MSRSLRVVILIVMFLVVLVFASIVFLTLGSGDDGGGDANVVSSPTPIPRRVAVEIVDESGEEVGEGTFRVYTSRETVEYPGTIRVELEVYFDNYFITPTPAGAVTRIPARSPEPTDRVLSPRRTKAPTSTPIIVSEPEQVFYQVMGASLECPEGSFTGCRDKEARPTSLTDPSWTWILLPSENASSTYDLNVSVWQYITVNGMRQRDILWSDTFQLRVTEKGGGISPVIIAAIITAVIGPILVLLVRRLLGENDGDSQK